MKESGFSIVELVVVLGIIGILLAIGTLAFSSMSRKGGIEAQVRTMHADMMTERAQALYLKRDRAVIVSGNQFRAYSSTVTDVAPLYGKTLKFPVKQPLQVNFSSIGMTNYSTAAAICLQSPDDGAVVDTIVVTASIPYMGKLQKGAACSSDKIDFK